MMNSSFDDDDDNAFGANPFRSTSGSNDDGDLLGMPNPTASLPNPSTLDPVSGFSGQLDHMPPSQQQQQFQQQQQQQFQQQQSYNNLTGSMDNARANVNQNNNNNNNNGGGQYGSNGNTDNTNSNSPFFRFPTWGGCMNCLRLESYTQYFDVDTADVSARIKAAMTTFWKPDQFRTAILGEAGTDDYKGPDLYGPLWVCMTLIFIIAVTSNLSAYMHHQQSSHAHHRSHSSSSSSGSNSTNTNNDGSGAADEQEFENDLHHLVRALTVVSTFVFGVPTFFWLATICLGMPGVSLALWICCYGYSMVPYQMAALLAWIPWEIVEWFVLASATAASALLVVRNLSTPLMQQDSSTHTKAAPLIMAMMGAHVCFLFVLKFTFYP
jgi:hypothetical protein